MFEYKLVPSFLKSIKKYKKKFPSIKEDLIKTLKEFSVEGAISLGKEVYKIRLRSSDIPKGKNKSFRVILLVKIEHERVYPIDLYFKGDKENITSKEIATQMKIITDEANI